MDGLLVAGVDEAGRGPVIGPLVIAGLVVEEGKLEALVELGVRDSKRLSPGRRERLEPLIRRVASEVEVLEVSAEEIDLQRRAKRSLNILEARWMAEVLSRMKWDIAYVDASDVMAERYGRIIQSHLATKRPIVSEHRADDTYPIVAAASILAKVRRDRRIRELHRKYGDFGSGYPTDPKTQLFLKEWLSSHGTLPNIVRMTWETVRTLQKARHRRSL